MDMNSNTTNGLILSSFSMVLIGVLRIVFQKFKTSECRVGGLTLKMEEIENVINENKNDVQEIKNILNNLQNNTVRSGTLETALKEVVVEHTLRAGTSEPPLTTQV